MGNFLAIVTNPATIVCSVLIAGCVIGLAKSWQKIKDKCPGQASSCAAAEKDK